MTTVWNLVTTGLKRKLDQIINTLQGEHLPSGGYAQYNDGWNNALCHVRQEVEDVFDEIFADTSEENLEHLNRVVKAARSFDTALKETATSTTVLEFDPVNHPSHYMDGGIETLDFILAKKLDFLTGQVAKYISRAGKKDPAKELEDLKKAQFYLNRKVADMEEKSKEGAR